MPPTQIRETSSPVLPGFTYFLHDSSDPFGWQLAQHTPLSAFEGALTESLAVGDYVRTFSVTIVAAQAFYRVFWKPTTISCDRREDKPDVEAGASHAGDQLSR